MRLAVEKVEHSCLLLQAILEPGRFIFREHICLLAEFAIKLLVEVDCGRLLPQVGLVARALRLGPLSPRWHLVKCLIVHVVIRVQQSLIGQRF